VNENTIISAKSIKSVFNKAMYKAHTGPKAFTKAITGAIAGTITGDAIPSAQSSE
jgi:hypothetical protein